MNNDNQMSEDSMRTSSEQARREFLRKAGQFAAYTPPVMLALMYPGAHAVASGGTIEEKKPKKVK